MFELIRAKQTIRFMRYSKPAMFISILLIVGSLITLSIKIIYVLYFGNPAYYCFIYIYVMM